MLLFFTALPVIAPPRPFTPQGWLGQLLLFERRLDTPANAFPSYHAFWVLLAMSLYAARMPRARYLWWALGSAVCVSCLTTGMHSLADVGGGVALFVLVSNGRRLWELLRAASERLANSWQEWQWGGVRLINHGLYAGIGAALAVAIVGFMLGPRFAGSVLLVGFSALVSAALWAQFVEGSPSLLRPYGYYGGVLGVVLGGLLARLIFGHDPWLLLAAYGVAGPWVQSFGRLRCLVQGCCHGRAAPPGIGIIYQHPRSRVCRLADLKGVPIHPTPLYSILWNIIIAAVMVPLWLAQTPLALIVGLYLILTGVGRFVEEAYRGEPQTRYIKGLRFYLWIAVVTVIAGAIVTCVKTQGAPPTPRPEALTLVLAAGFGLLTWFALGVDFPRSNRRFARLA
jgi:prolipoprotein diacylglyceryltransferase